MSSKILSHPSALCNIVRRIAEEAGELILDYHEGVKDMEVNHKVDSSPVTKADQEAEKLIEQSLFNILPEIPVIGEESFASGKRINFFEHDYFWLVDPLDGTRAFIAGENEFTVNIGLIYKNSPILGVIYAPAKGELYAGYIGDLGAKAFRYFEDSNTEKDMKVRQMPKQGITVMSSNYCKPVLEQDDLLEKFKVRKVIRRSSSLKICNIANGKADIYPRFGNTCEWDTAAGHAILRAAGGDIRDMNGKPLQYGGANPKLLNPHFIASSLDIFDSGVFE